MEENKIPEMQPQLELIKSTIKMERNIGLRVIYVELWVIRPITDLLL